MLFPSGFEPLPTLSENNTHPTIPHIRFSKRIILYAVYTNPDINAQDFGRKMKKAIPIEKFYTAVFFLLKQNIIFFKPMAYPSQEKVQCFLCEEVVSLVAHVYRHFNQNHPGISPNEGRPPLGNWLRLSALKFPNKSPPLFSRFCP